MQRDKQTLASPAQGATRLTNSTEERLRIWNPTPDPNAYGLRGQGAQTGRPRASTPGLASGWSACYDWQLVTLPSAPVYWPATRAEALPF